MRYVIFFILIIAIFAIRHKVMRRIDEDEKTANNTPGTAHYIRLHYPNLIEIIEQKGFVNDFERENYVRLKRQNREMIVFQKFSDKLMAGYVHNDQLIQEWRFGLDTSVLEIVEQISKYL